MSFTDSARVSLNNNRSLKDSIRRREFKSAKYDFMVNAAPKLVIDEEGLTRSQHAIYRKDRITLFVMIFATIIVGIAVFYLLS